MCYKLQEAEVKGAVLYDVLQEAEVKGAVLYMLQEAEVKGTVWQLGPLLVCCRS